MVRMAATDLDHLYQLPLDEFTAARNALAKKAGTNAGAIRALVKPPVAAWAVNQLYWRERRAWDALVSAAENQRSVNKAVLGGRAGDVRAAGQVHDEAVQVALKATLALLARDGHPATDATKLAIVNTLRAVPGGEAPGRLTRALQPGGFEMLAGLTLSAGTKATTETAHAKPLPPAPKTSADVKALTKAREAAASADRALKDAEQAVRRHEFEIARATRDEERAAKTVEQAHAALAAAKTDLANAERDERESTARRESAEAAAKKAVSAVDAARSAATAASAALKKLNSA